MAVDDKPKRKEAFVLDYVSTSSSYVITINLRIRTQNHWKYYKNLHVGLGQSLIVSDGEGVDTADDPRAIIESLPHKLEDWINENAKKGDK